MKKITVLLLDGEEKSLQEWSTQSGYPLDLMAGIFLRQAMIWYGFFREGFLKIPPEAKEVERRINEMNEKKAIVDQMEKKSHHRAGIVKGIKQLLGKS